MERRPLSTARSAIGSMMARMKSILVHWQTRGEAAQDVLILVNLHCGGWCAVMRGMEMKMASGMDVLGLEFWR